MTQYIDKAALVAEIEKLLAFYSKEIEDNKEDPWAMNIAKRDLLQEILSFLNTLEVKEVDLEKELDSMITPELKFHKALPSLFDVSKHFFELGLRSTITEEDCKLIWNIGDEIPCMTEEEFFKELLRRYKAQKGEGV
jgi:uncharacterized protein YbaR (Trm112 family)